MSADLRHLLCGLACVLVMAGAQGSTPKDLNGGSHITIAVDQEGNITWNGQPVSCEELNRRFDQWAQKSKSKRHHRIDCRKIDEPNAGSLERKGPP